MRLNYLALFILLLVGHTTSKKSVEFLEECEALKENEKWEELFSLGKSNLNKALENNDTLGVTLSRKAIGEFYLDANVYDSATHYLALAADGFSENESSQMQLKLETLLDLSTVHRRFRATKKAEDIYAQVIELSKKNLNQHAKYSVKALAALGEITRRKGNNTLAKNYLNSAIQQIEKYEVPPIEASFAYEYLSRIYIGKNQPDSALGFQQKALALLKDTTSAILTQKAMVLNSTSYAYRKMDNNKKALEALEASKDIYIKIKGGNDRSVGIALLNMCNLMIDDLDFSLAEPYIKRSLEILEQNPKRNKTSIYSAKINYAQILQHQGKYKLAQNILNQVRLAALTEATSKMYAFKADYFQIPLYTLTGQLDSAQYFLEEGKSIAAQFDGREASMLYYLKGAEGELLLSLKKYQAAYDLYAEVYAYGKQQTNGQPDHLAAQLLAMGKCSYFLGDTAKAILETKQGLTESGYNLSKPYDYEEVVSKEKPTIGLNFLAQIYFDQWKSTSNKRLLDSISFYQTQAITAILNLQKSAREPASAAGIAQLFNSVLDASLSRCYHLHEATQKNEFIEAAFLVMEVQRDYTLKQAVRMANIQKFGGALDSLLMQKQNLQTEVNFKEKQLLTEKVPEDLSMQESLVLANEKIAKINQRIKNEFPKFYELNSATPILELNTLQGLLTENQTFVEYKETDKTVFMLKADNKTAHLIKVEKPENYHNLINGLLTQSKQRTPNKAVFTKNAFDLYNLLIKPLSKTNEELILVPDGLLTYVPFELLTTENSQDYSFAEMPYLIKNKQISYNFSATLWHQLTETTIESKRLLALAPNFEALDEGNALVATRNFTPLIFNQQEAKTISEATNGDLLENKEASWYNLNQKLADYSIFHFATHALTNDENSELSYLALSEKQKENDIDKLYVKDLYSLKMNADLVVLSACETGIGTLKKGEGIVSMGRGFTYAGAKAVITSLWSVNDKATADIMRLFYKNLGENMSKSSALRKAKLDYMLNQKNDALSSPFYWAPFVVYGDVTPIQLKNSWGSVWYWSIFGFAFSGVVGFVLIKKNKATPRAA